RVATVLYQSRPDARPLAQPLELFETDVADPEQTGAAAVVDRLHRPPGRPVVRRQASPLRRAVQHVGIDHIGSEMFEGAGEGLLYLGRDRGLGVVWQAMVLPAAEREFGLEEQVFPANQSALDRLRDGLADRCLMVMSALIGSVDAAEALL